MSSPETRPPSVVPPAVPSPRAGESFRAKSISTRITETEFAEIESVASAEGKKVAEWLREAALAQARGRRSGETDPVLLAELMAVRNLLVNLFASASRGPLSEESIRKMTAYADSIKLQKAEEFLASRKDRKTGKV
jgi:Mobilization protein NikA